MFWVRLEVKCVGLGWFTENRPLATSVSTCCVHTSNQYVIPHGTGVSTSAYFSYCCRMTKRGSVEFAGYLMLSIPLTTRRLSNLPHWIIYSITNQSPTIFYFTFLPVSAGVKSPPVYVACGVMAKTSVHKFHPVHVTSLGKLFTPLCVCHHAVLVLGPCLR